MNHQSASELADTVLFKSINTHLDAIKANTAETTINAGDLELHVDGLEGLVGTTNTKLQTDLDFAGQPNAIGDSSNMKRVMNYGHDSAGGQQRPLLVDNSGMLKVVVASGAGSATEAKQDVQETSLNAIQGAAESTDSNVTTIAENFTACDTGAVVISSSALPSGASTASLQGGGLPSALSSDNLKVSLKETITVPVSNAALTELASALNSDKLDVNISSGNISGFATATLQAGGLPSALSADNLKVSLKETITVPVSNTILTNLDNCIDTNELQVDIVSSALPSGASTASLQGGGLPSALSSDNLKVSLKESIAVGVTNTTLTNLNNCIDSNELQVDIVASALPSGAATESSLSSVDGKIRQGYDNHSIRR